MLRGSETLDPDDWQAAAALAHSIMDDAVQYLSSVRERPLWQPMSDPIRAQFAEPLPMNSTPLADVYEKVRETVMQYPMGNIHPQFWSWYMGAGNFTGALADFIAAVQGSNLGGGSHAAALLDQQLVGWMREIVGFPETGGGTLASGGSVANLLCLTVARNSKASVDIREKGIAALEKPLRFYASDQVHYCHRKAMETLGIGNDGLRKISSNSYYRIDVDALRQAIDADRKNGMMPACIIANAGTVNTGAIDDLNTLADLATEQDMWLHIDGCIGALLAIAPQNSWRVNGLNRADSIALDPHKWLHAPFEVGCALIKDRKAHRQTFAVSPEYLQGTTRGIASGEWLYEYGLQTSRGFAALKVWMALMEHGAGKFGRLIDQNIGQARLLASLIKQHPRMQLMCEPETNICCFRYRPESMPESALHDLNIEIMLRLQETGVAALSDTTIHEQHCLRAAICNHRTRNDDLHLLISAIDAMGAALSAQCQ
ncbi:MAG: pyridoxal-dependent decarboxylase [Mesorhizobium sp.]